MSTVPCEEVIDIGPFRFECQGHEEVLERDANGKLVWQGRVLAPHVHHSPRSPRHPGDVEVTWWTE